MIRQTNRSELARLRGEVKKIQARHKAEIRRELAPVLKKIEALVLGSK
jgi:hypothetical protein